MTHFPDRFLRVFDGGAAIVVVYEDVCAQVLTFRATRYLSEGIGEHRCYSVSLSLFPGLVNLIIDKGPQQLAYRL